MSPLRRNILLATVTGLLIALNLWRWWPSAPTSGAGHERAVASRGFQVEDFVVRALPQTDMGHGKRDPFHMVVKVAPKLVQKGPPPPPPKTPEQLAAEAAQAELAQLRCVGVVFRGGEAQAFMVVAGQDYLARVGEKAGSRFVVEKIDAEAVFVRDPVTQVGGKIDVSGK